MSSGSANRLAGALDHWEYAVQALGQALAYLVGGRARITDLMNGKALATALRSMLARVDTGAREAGYDGLARVDVLEAIGICDRAADVLDLGRRNAEARDVSRLVRTLLPVLFNRCYGFACAIDDEDAHGSGRTRG